MDLHTPYLTVSFRMTLSDFERLRKIFNDTKRRAVSLRQLSFLFHTPLHFDASVRGVPVGILSSRSVRENQNGGATRWCKNFQDMFHRLETILACVRQTDGRTSCDGIVRAISADYAVARCPSVRLSDTRMHTRRAVTRL